MGLKHTLFSWTALALGGQGGQFDPPILVCLVYRDWNHCFLWVWSQTTGGMFGKRENLFPEYWCVNDQNNFHDLSSRILRTRQGINGDFSAYRHFSIRTFINLTLLVHRFPLIVNKILICSALGAESSLLHFLTSVSIQILSFSLCAMHDLKTFGKLFLNQYHLKGYGIPEDSGFIFLWAFDHF